MSLLVPRGPQKSRQAPAPDIWSIIRGTSPRWGATPTPAQAMRNSVLWACLDLRASLVSSLPVQQSRPTPDGRETMAQLAPLWRNGGGSLTLGGPTARLDEWLYATQLDLDRFGNTYGMIVQRDSLQRPLRIDLLPAEAITVTVKDSVVTYKLHGKPLDAANVWHERAHVVPGSPVGLDPLGMAAMALATYESAADFAAGWFSTSGLPGSVLRNTLASLTPDQAAQLKERVKGSVAQGDVLVLGKEYEFSMVAVPPNQTAFLELMQAKSVDLARYMSVPADMVDVHESGASITYANVTQRNLQFLTLHLGPAIRRRELAMSGAIAQPWQIELERQALLQMDPMQQAQIDQVYVNSRVKHPDEIRTRFNLPPLTAEQMASFELLFARTTEKLDDQVPPANQPAESSAEGGEDAGSGE